MGNNAGYGAREGLRVGHRVLVPVSKRHSPSGIGLAEVVAETDDGNFVVQYETDGRRGVFEESELKRAE